MRGEKAGPRNQVYGEPYRGFKSLPLRQFFHFHNQRFTSHHWFPIKSLSDKSQVRFSFKNCLFVRDLSESLIQPFGSARSFAARFPVSGALPPFRAIDVADPRQSILVLRM